LLDRVSPFVVNWSERSDHESTADNAARQIAFRQQLFVPLLFMSFALPFDRLGAVGYGL
jgi:hypothetical protein